jgi:hypothetical protein
MSNPLYIDPSILAEEIQMTVDEFNRLTALAASMLLKVDVLVITEDRSPLPDRTLLDARISVGR